MWLTCLDHCYDTGNCKKATSFTRIERPFLINIYVELLYFYNSLLDWVPFRVEVCVYSHFISNLRSTCCKWQLKTAFISERTRRNQHFEVLICTLWGDNCVKIVLGHLNNAKGVEHRLSGDLYLSHWDQRKYSFECCLYKTVYRSRT